ncbi:MAG: CDP-diacylglycerol--glycerol-3-phosphate 3-phosphatidyltransferase [Oscillospiraceae bacterium]|jgi:cardiolipin synthase|nr:CDP-diacylglycerol--glycerol-3-phosphate 3-phosphatidyltransferase [Oscillospiraceae bacterium]
MNVPNALSLLRIFMVPVFVCVFFMDTPNAHRYAGIIFATAFATDVLDGYIARKYNKITRLGRVLDPLADKLMTFAAILCVGIKSIIPLWIVVCFFIKEMMMGLGALLMYKKTDDVLPSNMLGKASTVIFFTACLALMLFHIPRPYSTVMLTVALATTVCALSVYAYKLNKMLRSRGNG